MSESYYREGDKTYRRIINWIEGWSVILPVEYTEDAEVVSDTYSTAVATTDWI